MTRQSEDEEDEPESDDEQLESDEEDEPESDHEQLLSEEVPLSQLGELPGPALLSPVLLSHELLGPVRHDRAVSSSSSGAPGTHPVRTPGPAGTRGSPGTCGAGAAMRRSGAVARSTTTTTIDPIISGTAKKSAGQSSTA